MSSITVNHRRASAVVERAGANPDLAGYDPATNTLTCPDVDQPTLDAARAAIVNSTGAARAQDKKEVRQQIRRKALRAHEQAILAADAVFQTKLTEINAATTLAQLEAIDYP
jgi:hypothetical protein